VGWGTHRSIFGDSLRRMMKDTTCVTTHFPQPAYLELRAFAQADERHIAQIVRRAVAEYLERRAQSQM
jgi:hypothetical protein